MTLADSSLVDTDCRRRNQRRPRLRDRARAPGHARHPARRTDQRRPPRRRTRTRPHPGPRGAQAPRARSPRDRLSPARHLRHRRRHDRPRRHLRDPQATGTDRRRPRRPHGHGRSPGAVGGARRRDRRDRRHATTPARCCATTCTCTARSTAPRATRTSRTILVSLDAHATRIWCLFLDRLPDVAEPRPRAHRVCWRRSSPATRTPPPRSRWPTSPGSNRPSARCCSPAERGGRSLARQATRRTPAALISITYAQNSGSVPGYGSGHVGRDCRP